MSEGIEMATVVHVYQNRVWIETDFFGDAHVMLQSEAPGSTSQEIATVHYNYPFVDNSTRNSLAETVAEAMGATKPIKYGFRATPSGEGRE